MSTSSISTTTVNGTTRITGLASGLDVDGIVEKLVLAEKSKKLNKLQQQVQTTEWKQEAYRSIISDVQEFASTYFDITSSKSLLNASNYLNYTASSDSSAVSVATGSSASSGNHTIQVNQLATAAVYSSSASVSKAVAGSAAADYSSLGGKSFLISLDGTSYTVKLDAVTDLDSLQTAVDTAVGTGKLTVSETDDGYLTLAAADSGVQAISISAAADANTGLTDLFGDEPVLSNRLQTSDTLATIAEQLNSGLSFNADGQIELTINGTSLTFDQDDTLADVITQVNKAGTGAVLAYNSVSGKLTLTADATGAGNLLTVSEGEGSSFIASFLSNYTAGVDAKLTIDGQTMTRSTNTVSVDGVTYTLNQETTAAVTVSVTQDSDGLYDLIEGFVDAYNELIATINTAIGENADSDYPPLTDDQKADMTEDEIEAWEAKAKVGLLENDSTLKSLLSSLRTAVVDSVSGQSVTLASIGISSGTYDTKGTLYITETTLKEAIASDPDAIMSLFTQQATATNSSGKSIGSTAILRSLSSSELSTRYKQEGIAYRFYDILQKNISTIRDNAGNKGLLLEKAGTEDDTTENDNTLSNLLERYNEALEEEEERLDEFEENMYSKYTALETYISSMNSQLSAITSLTSS
ncbi:MAG: flagellar filament capping protein FliD [Sporomusaceae bacterium]|nr:flagellar filament capping protein FliD [Sporomusaceae bacterium]